MRKNLLITAFLIFSFFSCQQDDNTNLYWSDEIIGSWGLYRTSTDDITEGEYDGIPNYPTEYIFYADNTFDVTWYTGLGIGIGWGGFWKDKGDNKFEIGFAEFKGELIDPIKIEMVNESEFFIILLDENDNPSNEKEHYIKFNMN